MSSAIWQNVVIVVVIAAALAYLIRSLMRRRKAASHCANCPVAKVSRRH